MKSENTIISMEDVSKIYQVGDSDVHALRKAHLSIRQGEFVSIIGPSGSGKSTLMNIIGCLDLPDEGHYYLNGMPIDSYSENDLAQIRNNQIGFIFQSFNLIRNLSAKENIELPLIYQRIPKQERHERVKEALQLVGLSDRAAHLPSELSGGQQQRVAIARALVTRPSLFLADEPTGNLDSVTGKEIIRLFKQLHAQGNTIIIITHDETIARQAERMVHIRDGQVLSA